MIRFNYPGSGSCSFTHPGSRRQKGTESRIRIRKTDLEGVSSYDPHVLKASGFRSEAGVSKLCTNTEQGGGIPCFFWQARDLA